MKESPGFRLVLMRLSTYCERSGISCVLARQRERRAELPRMVKVIINEFGSGCFKCTGGKKKNSPRSHEDSLRAEPSRHITVVLQK